MKRLSKKTNLLIIGCLVILTVILFWVLRFEKNTVEDEYQFIDQIDQIESISIQSDQGFTIEKENQNWQVVDRLEVTDQEAVDQGLAALGQWVGKEVDVKRKDVGLEFPILSLKINYNDETANRLMIGHLDSAGTGYYIEDREQGNIYLVKRSLVEAFSFYPQAYLDSKILPWPINEIESILIDNGTEKIHLTKNSPYPEEETRANITGWFIEAPYHHYYHTAYSKMEEVLQGLQSFEMLELVAEDVSDWEEYGLDSSEFTIEFVTNNDRITLMMGTPATSQSYYARIDGEDQVFTLSNQLLEAFSYPASDYHDGYVKLLALDVMSQLEIKSDQLSFDMTIDQIDDETRDFIVDGKKIDEETWRKAYLSLAGLTASGIAEDASYQEPEVVIKSTIIHEKGEKEITLSLVDYNEDQYAAFIDQESDFLVDKADVEEMLTTIEEAIK
ncbi:DUF4340 domain-containing protein [Amphibacillus sp. MSJ-3]|uniref:DUF4340 domain-containing protein n=1 Tax=Amphibacillus sp. MSJ-3 TaxID=2841505 RepID=UPI001C0E9461|nr:DUF4340 domain-containing protein [Amphibacillus sp. MSJ-3]MBU5593954.1 DUF4340 domain-containing protein [Amphibacillus sp. MSJ-3]